MENLIVDTETGIVEIPHVHDSVLIGIVFDGKAVRIQLRNPAQKTISLVLDEVLYLSVESLFESNTIFEIRVASVDRVTSEEFQRLLHLSSEQQIDNGRIEKLKAEKLFLVQIIPNFGADILALCKEVACVNK